MPGTRLECWLDDDGDDALDSAQMAGGACSWGSSTSVSDDVGASRAVVGIDGKADHVLGRSGCVLAA